MFSTDFLQLLEKKGDQHKQSSNGLVEDRVGEVLFFPSIISEVNC